MRSSTSALVVALDADLLGAGTNCLEDTCGQNKNSPVVGEKNFHWSLNSGITLEGTNSELSAVWPELKARIDSFLRKWRRSEKEKNLPSSAEAEATGFDSARMTHNRMQALDGAGYRQCYMDKLREVASEGDKPEANREYWFGKEEVQVEAKAGADKASTSHTKLPKLRDVIPSQARITSTRLQAYVETLPKPEDD